jgi:predicted HAD superfamily phosphohydrolase
LTDVTDEGDKRIYCTDLEGPVTKNDNAAELCATIVPEGDELFRRVSLYDDYLAEVINMPGYRAGDTLRLILPFMMAHGLTQERMASFSSRGILIVPGADKVLSTIAQRGPAYIISTSYCQYVHAVCSAIAFPREHTFCTRVNLDDYAIPDSEVATVKKLASRVMARPPIEIPALASGPEDLTDADQATVADLDEVFWDLLPELSVYTVVEEVSPVGGPEKATSIRKAAKHEEVSLDQVVYVGDSITDVDAFRTVRQAGGLAVSFNGNRWAVEEADMAIVSPRADPVLPMAIAFLERGKDAVEGIGWAKGIRDCTIEWLAEGDIEEVVEASERMRKEVRGTVVGRLG